jgi:hypothetical protein
MRYRLPGAAVVGGGWAGMIIPLMASTVAGRPAGVAVREVPSNVKTAKRLALKHAAMINEILTEAPISATADQRPG